MEELALWYNVDVDFLDKSLKELGAGRSILIDSENEIIAGNGVFEQAEKQNIKIKIVGFFFQQK